MSDPSRPKRTEEAIEIIIHHGFKIVQHAQWYRSKPNLKTLTEIGKCLWIITQRLVLLGRLANAKTEISGV